MKTRLFKLPQTLAWFCVFALIAGMLVARSHFKLVFVSGDSMLPTYKSGDLLLVYTTAYRAEAPERGDVVIARYQGELLVKRVAGLPGEEVEVRNGRLLINGTPVRELEAEGRTQNVAKGKLLSNRFAILGDNRVLSAAITVQAVVGREDFVGKVVGKLSSPLVAFR